MFYARSGERGQRSNGIHTSIPAPVNGLVLNEALAVAVRGSARVLENWFPTNTGVRMRKGAYGVASLDVPVVSMWGYQAGVTTARFAASADAIFDVTAPADADVAEAPVVAGLTSGYFSTTQIATGGGSYLIAVNGDDDALLFDGTSWFPISAATTYSAIVTGATGALSGTLTGTTSTETATIDSATEIDTGVYYLRLSSPSGAFTDDEDISTDGGGGETGTLSGNLLASPVNISGVATDILTQVWLYGNRPWFVEKNSTSAWYLAVDSIGGALTEFDLGAVFQKGGNLLFGASWSSDSGDGMQDRCVFVSDAGEVAVYFGTDPSSSTTWGLQGRYDIPKAKGKNAWLKVAGDLLIVTEEGFMPISQVVTKDPAALSLSAVSRSIESEWRAEARQRTLPWEAIKWNESNIGIISLPTSDPDGVALAGCFAVNLDTGAWSRFIGWDTRCMAVIAGKAYFGTNTGRILEMERGGTDDGALYECRISLAPDNLDAPGRAKIARLMRAIFRASTAFKARLSVSTDYNIRFPAAPSATDSQSPDVWDAGLWDQAVWDGAAPALTSLRWQGVTGRGIAIAPQLQVTQGDDVAPDVELISLDVIHETGGVVP